MSEEVPSRASVLVAADRAVEVERALGKGDLEFEAAGVPRGVADAVQLFVIATPSVAALMLLLEKLRRLRLPRTYLRVRDGELEIWTDQNSPDGRFVVVGDDGSVEELPDGELSMQALLDALDSGDE